MILGNRRSLIFRMSIVINIAVVLYVVMHFFRTTTSTSGCIHISKQSLGFPYLNRKNIRNKTETEPAASIIKICEESTSQESLVPPTASTTKETDAVLEASSTASITELEKTISDVPLDLDLMNETLDIVDENALSNASLARLRLLLACTDKEFRSQTMQRGEYWVLKNYVRADHGMVQCHESITYTTHAGFEFLDNVQPLVETWMAPISIAVHAPGADMAPTVSSIRYLRDCTGNELVRQYVTFHVFFSYKHIPNEIANPDSFMSTSYNCTGTPPYTNHTTTYMKEKNILYPVNVARNIAREAALTHFILPSDIELYPSPNLTPRFLNMIARNAKPLNESTKPRVFPISIFEIDINGPVPLSKTQLKSMLDTRDAIPFHKFICPYCHEVPQGQQWMNSNETNQMDVFHVGKRQDKYVHWEPVFIGTHQDPYYDERLSWEGKSDKMTQAYILCVKDYDFMILNNAFLIHKPGIKLYKEDEERDMIEKNQTIYVKTVIMPELKKLYGTRAGCDENGLIMRSLDFLFHFLRFGL